MSRIDVLRDGKEFRILVNFIQFGTLLHNLAFANAEAKKVQEHYPKAELHLLKEKEI